MKFAAGYVVWIKVKGKGIPYSITSLGTGADPGL